MIFVFHGEDQSALREELLRIRKGYAGGEFWTKPLSQLAAYLHSPSLFGKKELVLIEDPDLSSLRKELLKEWASGGKDVALVFSRRLSLFELERFEGAQIRGFAPRIPKNVFPFLDALVARKKAEALVEAHRLLREGNDLDFLLNMITWQLRNLVRVKSGSVKGMKRYTIDKLRRFSARWSDADLRRAFAELLKEDLRRKKGSKNPLDFLVDQIVGQGADR